MRTTEQLHSDTLAVLAPITRDLYTYTGRGVTRTVVNPEGVDVHDGHLGTAALAQDGTVHPYALLTIHPRTDAHARLSRGASRGTFGFTLLVASGGSPQSTRWALDKITSTLARARLHESTGLLVPYFDQVDVLQDPDATPPRWQAPLRFTTTVH